MVEGFFCHSASPAVKVSSRSRFGVLVVKPEAQMRSSALDAEPPPPKNKQQKQQLTTSFEIFLLSF